MRATRTFKDDQGVTRKNGEEWLITMKETETHIPNVYEEVGVVEIQVLKGDIFMGTMYTMCSVSRRDEKEIFNLRLIGPLARSLFLLAQISFSVCCLSLIVNNKRQLSSYKLEIS